MRHRRPIRRPEGKALLVVLLIVLAMALAALLLLVVALRGVEVVPPGEMVVEVDLTRVYTEARPDDPLALALWRREPTLWEVLGALERAAQDRRVVGLVARVGATSTGLAVLQELRDAVLSFRESGKPAIAFTETLGEFGPGNGAYYLATAFDEIHLQPSGDVGITGVRYEVPFYRGALDKLGVVPQLGRRHEYKNAPESYTEKELSEAHRQALQAVADSQFGQLVRGIATGRGLSEARVRELFDGGPYLGPEALELGLVDRLAYRDEVWEALRGRFGAGLEFRELDRYLERPIQLRGGRTVALIHGVGPVVRGRGGFDPLTGSPSMGSDTVARAFREAVEDRDVEAILFRVDSPGGSYVASDTIWREVVRARASGKPVIVSMGDLAGSGGYFVALAADSIVAQPGTITGSIGVYGGKLVTRDGWAKLGISWGEISAGERAGFWSGVREFAPGERQRLEAWLDRIYDDFTAKVAEGRGLDTERVEEVARGRIWTGEDALAVGLVDELGGYAAALDRVRGSIGAAPDEAIRVRSFPRPRSPWEILREGAPWFASAAEPWLRRAAAVARWLERLGVAGPEPGPLTMRWQPESR